MGKIVGTAASIWNGVRALHASVRWDEKEFAHRKTKTGKGGREREYRAGDRIDKDKHRRKPYRWSSRLTEVEATKWGKQTHNCYGY